MTLSGKARRLLSFLPRRRKQDRSDLRSCLRDSDFLPEEVFREVLSFERKRSERSRKTVALMLLDIAAAGDGATRCAIAKEIARALADAPGETPVRGWYRHEEVLGLLFTNARAAGNDGLRERVLEKIPPALLDQVLRLEPVFHAFPGEMDGQSEETLFYPDSFKQERNRKVSLALKRAMDITGGVAGLVLFLPLFITLPLLIKATSKGPVLFKQERIGRHGQPFVFLKFRTMTVDSDPGIHQEYIKKLIQEQQSYAGGGQQQAAVYKIKDDPRVTPVGKLLRKTSMDELPQFLNVLRGDMSLVGPRPPIPYELENYDLWHRRRVMEIKPGITGLWQVEGRSSTTFDEMVRLDLKYAKEWTLWLDIKLLLKTPWVVLTGKGGY